LTKNKESTTYAGHDTRQEFSQSLKNHLDELYECFKLSRHNDSFKIISFVYGSIRALLSSSECLEFEGLLDKARVYSDRRTPKRARTYELIIEQMGYMLYDLAHAHKLLLPHYSSEEEDLDLNSFLSEGGL